MPPRTATSSAMPLSVQDQQHEVVCPLRNADGSQCRKRCFGEKRYRSMQEHIRRAHPDHYLPKLPATEESFQLMINTPPHPVPDRSQPQSTAPSSVFAQPATTTFSDSFFNNHAPSTLHTARDPRRGSLLPAASAAAALASLHQSRPSGEWDPNEQVNSPTAISLALSPQLMLQTQAPGPFADTDPNIHNYFANPDAMLFNDTDGTLGSLSGVLPGSRSGSLQPFGRKPNRPRKSSVTENARKPQHERQRSKDKKRFSHDRKGYSTEPPGVSSKRWEDLLDAAASATEEDSRDLTPIPQSPRSSMPPQTQGQSHNPYQSYTTSPLQNTILPQSPEQEQTFEPPPIEAFPSVEASFDNAAPQNSFHQHHPSTDSSASNTYGFARHQAGASGSNFHMPAEGLDSSPNDNTGTLAHLRTLSSGQGFPSTTTTTTTTAHAQQPNPPLVQHYCAACHHSTPLNSSYACTECICGICRDCVDVLINMPPDRAARCPKCQAVGGKFKPFMLDLR